MEIFVLGEPDDDDALGIEIAEKSRKPQTGTVDADARERDDAPARIQHLQSKIGGKLVEHDGFLG